jgi:subtilisin family serine protease
MSFDQSLAPFGLPQAVLATGARNFHGRGIDGTGIKIAVIDTLADPNHPVLKKASNGGLKLKQKAMVRNAVIADHGTATCALVGGFGGVDVAYSGVAPGCQIINYGVFTYSA